jgi:hypothetical protein
MWISGYWSLADATVESLVGGRNSVFGGQVLHRNIFLIENQAEGRNRAHSVCVAPPFSQNSVFLSRWNGRKS